MKFSVLFKELIACLFRFTGLPLFIRNTYAKQKVTIIFYHDPAASVLDSHLKYLSKRYHFIPLDVLVNAIRTKNWSSIPPKAIVMTIDDGHKRNYELLRVFKKYNIKPTIYVCTQVVNTNRFFWWQLKGLNPNPLKELSNDEKLKYLIEEYQYTPVKEYSYKTRQALSLEEMNEMKCYVDFQSHSRFHPLLTKCSSKESAIEIGRSKTELERLLDLKCEHFSFPNGYYHERELTFVKEADYLSGRTTDLGWNDMNTDPYKLKAMGITDDVSINVLSLQVCGIPAYLKGVFKGNFTGKLRTTKLDDSSLNKEE
jgi:peptidoglycan/xylan/chitin deacetylase (PgdA/CDA1 family)